MATKRGKRKASAPKRGTGKPARSRLSRDPPKGLRRDTPLDLPAVRPGEALELIELPHLTAGAQSASEQALARVRAIETIESAYDAWLELRLHEAQLRARFAEERRRLEDQGALLLGAVRVASDLKGSSPEPALALTEAGLSEFLGEAKAKLTAARAGLDAQLAEAETSFIAAAAFIRDEIRSRVERRAKTVKPRVRLMVRVLDGDRRVLHAHRPDPEDAVALAFVFSGRIPSRFGFLFDDSTDDVSATPPTLYAEEGVPPEDVRPTPALLKSVLGARPHVWPVKGMLPMWLPPLNGAVVAVRWLERGPVMEAEIEDGVGFRGVLTREEAERITGYLLALKLEGRLELELVRG